ncbi:MAG: DNA translocase FtsK [Planktomarina sp.]
MAYPARGRDPLLDTATQAFLERRGREALGGVFLLIAAFLSLTLISYSAGDVGLMAVGASVQNWMGGLGASTAAALMKILGYGTWAIPVLLTGWGLRLVRHAGVDRMLTRGMYAPVVVAVASIYAATLPPASDWVHSFSMGGQFGDTVLFMVLQVLPGSAAMGANVMALILGLLLLGLTLYVLAVTIEESHFALSRVSFSGAALVGLIAGGTYKMKSARAERAAAMPAQDDAQRVASVVRANPAMPTGRAVPEAPEIPASSETQSLFKRMPSLLKRTAHVEDEAVIEPTLAEPTDRVRAKINSAIKSRVRPPAVIVQPTKQAAPRREPLMARPVEAPVADTPNEGPLNLRLPPVARVAPAAPAPVAADPMDDFEGNIFADDQDDFAPMQAEAAAPIPFTINPMPAGGVAVAKPMVQHRTRKLAQPSRQAKAEAQPALQLEPQVETQFETPPLSLLMSPETIERHVLSDEALEQNARMLESVLDDYGVKGEIVSVRPGPVVTMYELEPAPGLKASRVIGLADDIARSMSALSARVSTVPGRSVIGIELPNENREMVALRELLSTRDFGDSSMKLPLALGKDIGGAPIIANLAKMPHLLIAGTTGSGKSVAINTMILSLLYRLTPDECRMIMIDPKMLELSVYDGIPHLLSPVVTDPKKAVVALKWTVGEMEDRYRKMSKMGVRNIDGYNSRVADALGKGEMFSRTVQTGFDEGTGEPIFETEEFAPEKLPFIVVVVDEMADLMMVAGKEIEACIQRLAQMARASGIHIIMATQRPSVDVITGTIKANFPTRISFQVTSKVDSRTILGEMGAEQLLGQGDMLYMAGGGKITRVHGPFCSDEEVEEIVNFLKTFGPPSYVGGVVDGPEEGKESNIDAVLGLGGNTDQEDALYDTAVQIVAKDRKCSTSYIQRKLAIGYNKAARLVEQMEDAGLVSPANHVGKREILMPEHN